MKEYRNSKKLNFVHFVMQKKKKKNHFQTEFNGKTLVSCVNKERNKAFLGNPQTAAVF